jgi:hypothetical protein
VKDNSGECDGRNTLVDAPSSEMKEEQKKKSDPEDRSTDIWIPASRPLPEEGRARIDLEAREDSFSAHLAALEKPLPRLGDTLITPPPREAMPSNDAPIRRRADPAEMHPGDQVITSSVDEDDTLEMTPEEAAAVVARAQAEAREASITTKATSGKPKGKKAIPSSSVDLTIPDHASPFSERSVRGDQQEGSPLDRECRVCGRKICSPVSVHFRGSVQNPRGFDCEACKSIVCADHAMRVSGFFESLFKQARFRCVLCASAQANPKDR